MGGSQVHISRAIGSRTCHHLQFGKFRAVIDALAPFFISLVGVGTLICHARVDRSAARVVATDMPSDRHEVTMGSRALHIRDLYRLLQLGRRDEASAQSV